MQYNDTANKNGIIQEQEQILDLGDATISGDATLLKHFTRWTNGRYHQIVTMVLASIAGWDFDDPNLNNRDFIKTFNLVADQEYVDLDIQANKILKIKRVEVTYDGTNWFKAEPFDINERGRATDPTSINNAFEETKPFYDLHGRWLYTYPIAKANSTDGLKVWFVREIDEFTIADTTQEPAVDEPFHRMLAIGGALDYAIAKDLKVKNDLQGMWGEYEVRLKQFYGGKDLDRNMVLKAAFENYE